MGLHTRILCLFMIFFACLSSFAPTHLSAKEKNFQAVTITSDGKQL